MCANARIAFCGKCSSVFVICSCGGEPGPLTQDRLGVTKSVPVDPAHLHDAGQAGPWSQSHRDGHARKLDNWKAGFKSVRRALANAGTGYGVERPRREKGKKILKRKLKPGAQGKERPRLPTLAFVYVHVLVPVLLLVLLLRTESVNMIHLCAKYAPYKKTRLANTDRRWPGHGAHPSGDKL